MSKHPSASGAFGEAHSVFSPPNAQTEQTSSRAKCQLPPCLRVLCTPQHTPCFCCDECNSHPQETLAKIPTRWALPVRDILRRCRSWGHAGGEAVSRGCNNQATTSLAPIPSTDVNKQKGTEHLHSCKLALEAGWSFSLSGVSVIVKITKKPKTSRLLTAAPWKGHSRMPSRSNVSSPELRGLCSMHGLAG